MRIVFLSSVDSYRRNEEVDLDPEKAHFYMKNNHAIEIATKTSTPRVSRQNSNKEPEGKKPTETETVETPKDE